MKAVAALVFLAGCQEYVLDPSAGGGNGAVPAIVVEPGRVDFGAVESGAVAEAVLLVRSVGQAPLTVSGWTLSGDDVFLADACCGAVLEPGDALPVPVRFAPDGPSAFTGALDVASDDPEQPSVRVDLVGSGLAPWLEIDPVVWDFGTTQIPCGDEQVITLRNAGNAPLHLTELTFAGDAALSLTGSPSLPLTLVPGALATATVAYTATEGLSSATLTAVSDDPRGPQSATQTGMGTYADEVTDVWAVPTDPPVDLLFAVDQSCSMDDDAISLGANFGAFIAAIEAETSGWHVGVVTQDDACFVPGWLDATTPGVSGLFSTAVTLGDDASVDDDERLFQLVDRALAQAVPGACNEGFLRAGAPLHVVFVSDEPERSTEEASAWDWGYFLGRFTLQVAWPPLFLASGVVDLDGCSEGANGYDDLVPATGGQLLSICQGDWSAYAASLAAASLGRLWTVPLSQPADASTLSVSVDGVPVTTGWTYDPVQNAVVFDDLSPGQTVEVDYGVLATCP
jgi:hypothetical protein